MRSVRRRTAIGLVTLLAAALITLPAWAWHSDDDLPPQVEAILGTWTGEWQLWGIDANGAVVPKTKWTDRMVATEATRSAERIVVKTSDEMTFAGGPGSPRTFVGSEGWRLAADGSLGTHFIESFGKVSEMISLRADAESSIEDVAPQELAQLGFAKGASGTHVLVKVVVQETAGETHRITRVTTVRWPGADGAERHLQFVSLQGYHRKAP